jgi:hypothetical protein
MQLPDLVMTDRIEHLKRQVFGEPRRLSVAQALLITESYRQEEAAPRIIQRARAFARAAESIPIRIDPGEIIVGNRTPGSRAGVVFPEAAVEWIDRELDSLPTRPQDPFEVSPADARRFREEILPYWRGKTLEDRVRRRVGPLIDEVAPVVKVNQTDHAQGHIIPNVRRWLAAGPDAIEAEARRRRDAAGSPDERQFYEAAAISLAAARGFMRRYAALAEELAGRASGDEERGELGLDFLCRQEVSRAMEYLKALPGVGPKTAACVLLFACRKPVLPVDTHVHRVSRRLGLIGSRTDAAKAHDELAPLVPERRVLDFHLQLIRHGRSQCTARSPKCPTCPLLALCEEGPRILAGERARRA